MLICEKPYEAIRADIMAAPPADRLDLALSYIEFVVPRRSPVASVREAGVRLAPAHAVILSHLARVRPRMVRTDVLTDLADASTSATVKVQVCKLRKLLPEKFPGVEIVTHWGEGYSLKAPEGYRFPWEVSPC